MNRIFLQMDNFVIVWYFVFEQLAIFLITILVKFNYKVKIDFNDNNLKVPEQNQYVIQIIFFTYKD